MYYLISHRYIFKGENRLSVKIILNYLQHVTLFLLLLEVITNISKK